MRVKSIAAGQGPGRKVSNAQASAPKLKISKLVDRRSRKFDAISLFSGTGHDISLYTLLRYKRGRVIAYDNARDSDYIRKKWEKRLTPRKLESVMLRLTVVQRDLQEWDEHVLLKDMQKAWGPECTLQDVTFLHASPSCKTLSTADRSRQHRNDDGSPRSAEAKRDDKTCAHRRDV